MANKSIEQRLGALEKKMANLLKEEGMGEIYTAGTLSSLLLGSCKNPQNVDVSFCIGGNFYHEVIDVRYSGMDGCVIIDIGEANYKEAE